MTYRDGVIEEIRRLAVPIDEGRVAYDALLDRIDGARIVLLGEASHGTHEFYRERARITRRLIEDRGFAAILVEGDWPEVYSLHRAVRHGEGSVEDGLAAFRQFPRWMWANRDILQLAEWLRARNEEQRGGGVAWLGLDVYSPYRALGLAAEKLGEVDAGAGERAREALRPLGALLERDLAAYDGGMVDAFAPALDALRGEAERLGTGTAGVDDPLFIARHSLAMADAGARYYAIMHEEGPAGWNLRDTAMMDALDRLLERMGEESRVVIWEHNAHVGDFRATADSDGRLNLGQLVRQRRPGEGFAVGFGTYEGAVTAAPAWKAPPQTFPVPPAQPGSWDDVFHRAGLTSAFLPLTDGRADGPLGEERPQRAIGAVHDPAKEREGYTPTRLARRYDAYIHIDRTTAVEPLE